MAEDLDPIPRKKLVSVERQYETDVSTGQTEVRIFVKFYIEARESGLLAALSDRMCRTLICLATYMDENGFCYPSQDELGRQLRVRRENVNLRLKELLAFRFNGRPVISAERVRTQTTNGSRWGKNVYHIHPISGFAIFDQEQSLRLDKPSSEPYVRKNAHRPMCDNTNIAKSHTNQNQGSNKKILNPLTSNDFKEGKRPTPIISDRALRSTYGLETAQLAKVHYLVAKQAELLGSGDRDHGHFVQRAAEAVAGGHGDLLDETLSRFKEIARKRSPSSHAAYFQTMWAEAQEQRQIRRRNGREVETGSSARRGGFEPLGDILGQSRGGPEADDNPKASLA